MKKIHVPQTICRAISALFILLVSNFYASAQPDIDFRNGVLIEGVANEVGAVYQFTNVKPGVDAKVTIVALTGGLTLSDLDGGGGFAEALQPIINIPAYSNGYAELQIDFYQANTTIPYILDEVSTTPIDIDGYYYWDGYLFEYAMVSVGSSYTAFDGTTPELNVNFQPGWVTGTNANGVTYDGIDTAAKQVMFTVVNSHVSSINIRVGADNQSSSNIQRLTSVYFKGFVYPSSILPVSKIVSLSGNKQGRDIHLNWKLSATNIKSITLEQSENGKSFKSLSDWTMNKEISMSYIDQNVSGAKSFYRIKIVPLQGKVEYSNVISFKADKPELSALTLYPTIVSSFASVKLSSDRTQRASWEVYDYSGKVVTKEAIQLKSGQNDIRLNGLDKLVAGNYICVIRTAEKTYSAKMQKQ